MTTEPSWLERTVEVYDNTSDEYVAEYPLGEVSLAELQSLWSQPASEPMVDIYAVTERLQVEFVQRMLGTFMDCERYSYFIAAATTDLTAMREAGGYMGRFPPPRTLPAFPDATRVLPKTDASPSDTQ